MGHRTMQGREIDMEKLMREHELMPAIGNMKVNARGDELGPGGVVVRRREEVVAEYYENNPAAKSARRPAPVQEKNVVDSVAEEKSTPTKTKKTQSEE